MEYLRDQTSLPYLPWKDNFTTEALACRIVPVLQSVKIDRCLPKQRNVSD